MTPLQRAQRGDSEAFLQLLAPNKDKLYRMALLYMKNETDALDVVQETICRAFTNIGTVREERYFSTWLVRILLNTATEFLRRTSKIINFDNRIEPTTPIEPIAERLDLLNAVSALPDAYKTVILLRYYEDLTVPQIAAMLQQPEGTVKTHLHRGMAILKKQFKEDDAYGQA